jgi:hypothetical protein
MKEYDILKVTSTSVKSAHSVREYTIWNFVYYLRNILEMFQQNLNFVCSFEYSVAADDNVLWLNKQWNLCYDFWDEGHKWS